MIPTDLPSSRNRRRHGRMAKDAQALALQRREYELCLAERAAVRWQPYDQPLRLGHERYWALRPDVAASDEASYLRRVLKLVQRIERCAHDGTVTERDWRRGNKRVAVEHTLGSVDAGTFAAMTRRMRTYFIAHVYRDRQTRYAPVRPPRLVYVIADPWKFVSRVRPHFEYGQWVSTFDGASEQAYVHHRLYGGEHGYLFRRVVHQRHGRGQMYDFVPFEREPLVDDEALP